MSIDTDLLKIAERVHWAWKHRKTWDSVTCGSKLAKLLWRMILITFA